MWSHNCSSSRNHEGCSPVNAIADPLINNLTDFYNFTIKLILQLEMNGNITQILNTLLLYKRKKKFDFFFFLPNKTTNNNTRVTERNLPLRQPIVRARSWLLTERLRPTFQLSLSHPLISPRLSSCTRLWSVY